MLAARKNFAHSAPPVDRRGALRAAPSSLLHVAFGSQHGGVILDISEGGFAVATALALLDRVVPHINITLDPGDDPIEVVGLTVWTTEATQRAGFQFIGLEAAQRERLRNWVRLHHPDACELLASASSSAALAPVTKKVWSSNPHLLTLDCTPATASLPSQPAAFITHEEHLPLAKSTETLLPAPLTARPLAPSPANIARVSPLRLSLGLAAAFIVGSAVTYFGTPRWSDRSSAAERIATPEDLGPANVSDKILPASQERIAASQSDQTVLILPAADNTPHRASLLKEELPGPVSVRVISQRSLYLPDHILHETTGPSISAKSLIPGRLLTEILPDFAAPRSVASPRQVLRIRVHVNEAGRVAEVFPISGPTAGMPAVLNAIAKWRYEPTLLDGQPVPTQVDLTIAPASEVQ